MEAMPARLSASMRGARQLLPLPGQNLPAGPLDLRGDLAPDQRVAHRPRQGRPGRDDAIHRVERPDDLVRLVQPERAQEDRRQELALAVDADVEQVLRVRTRTPPTTRGTE